MALPHFFVIGVPKAGTTALHVALAQHPQLFMSEIKEPKFFMSDGPPPARGGPGDAKTFREYVWRREDYENLFAQAPDGMLCGESTPFYLYDAAAQRRLHEAVPEARLIAVLRDPVDRAHSNWTHLWSAGLEPQGDFVAACRLEQQSRRGPMGPLLALSRSGPLRCAIAAPLYLLPTRAGARPPLPPDPRRARRDTRSNLRVPWRQASPSQGDTGGECDHARDGLAEETRPFRNAASSHHDRPMPAGPAPAPWRDCAARMIQSEQRRRHPLTLEQRAELIPYFAADIALLQDLTGQSFAEWLQVAHRTYHAEVKPTGRFGTAYQSIDRPLAEYHDRMVQSRSISLPDGET